MNYFVKKCKKKLIFSLIVLIFFISVFFNSYFSEGVCNIITTRAKITSQEYIGKIIEEEIISDDLKLFYESVSNDGVVVSSFNVNRANMILSKTMNSLKKISQSFNETGSFNVEIPAMYLFSSYSYILPMVKVNVEASELLYYEAKIATNIEEFGINSSLVSLVLTINIKYQVTVPMMFEIVENKIEIPLSIEVINGRVPEVLLSYQGEK